MNNIAKEYAGRSQEEIYRTVCEISRDIVKLRATKSWLEQSRLQRLRRERAALQALLRKPTLVWSAE